MGRKTKRSKAPKSTRSVTEPAIGRCPHCASKMEIGGEDLAERICDACAAMPHPDKDAHGNPSVPDLDWIELYLDAARAHGEQSEPDHEVGDLQDLLRDAWALLGAPQRHQLATDERFAQIVEDWS